MSPLNTWIMMKENELVRKFFEENSSRVFAYIMKMTGNKDDAEDCFQDCFIKYTEKYPDKLSIPLLYTVAKSVCIDSFRKNNRYQHNVEEQVSKVETPEDKMISDDTQRILKRAMDSLSVEERELISMAGPQGLKYKEISEITGMTLSNVKVKVHRVRIRLKELMGEGKDGK
ncbi:MAG: hypothetical protein C0603_12940 [Denitrovibrio sp.]|nr:MAG: hypothetical protein C0603_12940 [Denitrovibrio sp.]